MKSLRYLVCGAALLASVGASSASAVMWNPSGVNFSVSQEGTGTLATNTGATFACTAASTTLQAPVNGDTAMNVNAIPIAFSGCTSNNLFVAHVTTFGTWHFKATSLTSIDITATPDASGRVATFSVTNLGCHITVDGPVTIPNNTWNNATTTLSINSSANLELTATGTNHEACTTTIGSTAHFQSTNFSVPTAMLT